MKCAEGGYVAHPFCRVVEAKKSQQMKNNKTIEFDGAYFVSGP